MVGPELLGLALLGVHHAASISGCTSEPATTTKPAGPSVS